MRGSTRPLTVHKSVDLDNAYRRKQVRTSGGYESDERCLFNDETESCPCSAIDSDVHVCFVIMVVVCRTPFLSDRRCRCPQRALLFGKTGQAQVRVASIVQAL